MNLRQRFSRYFYPQVLIILACGILFSLLVFWFALQKITQNNFSQKENSVVQDRAQVLGFKAYILPSNPVWDFFGILPAAASTGKNCTYTVHYLNEHPELWNTSNNISTSRFSFTKNDLLSLFQTQTEDIPLLLQQQFLAAAVNVINGADPSAVEASMKDASGWVDAHPPRIDLPEADSQTGLQLIRQLQDYNDGNTGPGLCPGQSEPLAAFANSAPTSMPATNPAITVPQAALVLPTAHPPRLTRKNSGSSGQASETASSGPTPAAPPSLVSESPQQPPPDSTTSNPPPATQIQQAPVNPTSPPPAQVTEQAKGHKHPSKPQPAPVPPQGQGNPQPPSAADTPPSQPPSGGGGSNNGNGNSGNNGNGNNGGNQGNHYGNGQGNGNPGNHGNGNNGNHGGGGHGKGH